MFLRSYLLGPGGILLRGRRVDQLVLEVLLRIRELLADLFIRLGGKLSDALLDHATQRCNYPHRLRDGTTGGRLVLVTQHALSARITPDALAALHRAEPELTTRLRTMNREDCLSFFVRGDADLLMIYEARGFPPLPFDDTILRRTWMRDTLVPVCGGALRHRLGPDGRPAAPFPVIAYPPDSHFARLVQRHGAGATLADHGGRVTVETAFSVAALRLAEAGLGIAWVPHSLCVAQLMSGDLVNLGARYGQIGLDVSLFHAQGNLDARRVLARL